MPRGNVGTDGCDARGGFVEFHGVHVPGKCGRELDGS